MNGLQAWMQRRLVQAPLPQALTEFGERVRRRQKNYLSPLTLRIMAVNLLSLGILVGTILYLGRYQDRIIEVEAQALLSQARIFAGAIAEGATVQTDDGGNDRLLPPLARQMVRRLDEVTDAHTRLYDHAGRPMADSWVIGRSARARVGAQTLPDLMDNNLLQQIVGAGVRLIQSITPGRRVWPLYDEHGGLNSDGQRRELQAALDGNEAAEVYMGPDGHLLFSVAAPVQRYKQALGVLNLTRSGEQVEAAIRTVRTDILKVFLGALAVTILLSFYLARAIVVPIRRLASAADQVRSGQTRRQSGAMRRLEIPDFATRHDEIGELSGSLRAMTAALWQRMDGIESFAADVSHELKNPLASLRSAIETLGKVKDPAQVEKLRGIIEYDVVRLDRLITDIAGASRLDAELSRIALERIDIRQLLATLADIYGHQEDAQGRVLLDAAPDDKKGPLMVAGFESRLVQVFQNIVDNALSFSPPIADASGAVQTGTVRIGASRVGGMARIVIDDDGPGIPDAKLGAIFDRFYTERPAGEAFGQHSGLGLSISQQIIEAHRGTIRAANRLDAAGNVAGARFTVELPAL